MDNQSSFPTFALALAALLAASSPQAQAAEAPPGRATRHDLMAKNQGFLEDMCATVNGWKVLRLDPNAGMSGDELKAAGGDSKEAKALRAQDSDTGNLSQMAKDSLRAKVNDLKDDCTAMRDKSAGIPALTADGASLEKIDDGTWSDLNENISEILLEYQGRDAEIEDGVNANCKKLEDVNKDPDKPKKMRWVNKPHCANSNYKTSFPDGAGNPMNGPNSIGQLADSTQIYRTHILRGDVLKRAVDALKPPAPAKKP